MLHQVLVISRSLFHAANSGFPCSLVAPLPQRTYALHLASFQGFINPLNLDCLLLIDCKPVHSDHNVLFPVHTLLEIIGSILDFLLDISQLDCPQRSTQSFYLF